MSRATHPQRLLEALRANAADGRVQLTNEELRVALGEGHLAGPAMEVTRSLRRLESEGLVRREYEPGTRRRVIVVL